MNNIDQQIQTLFDTVFKQKKEIELAEKAISKKWKTNCMYKPLYGTIASINIQTADEFQIKVILRELFAFEKSEIQISAFLDENPEEKPTCQGYILADWMEDCKKRFITIQLKDKKTKLVKLEDRLNQILSPEQKRQLELEAIAKELDSIS